MERREQDKQVQKNGIVRVVISRKPEEHFLWKDKTIITFLIFQTAHCYIVC